MKFKVGDKVTLKEQYRDTYKRLFAECPFKILKVNGAETIQVGKHTNWFAYETLFELYVEEEDAFQSIDRKLELLKSWVIDDSVSSPTHYTQGNIETIDFIKEKLTEEEFRGYIKGNVLKYISRESLKNGDDDLQKAEWYLHYLNTGEKE